MSPSPSRLAALAAAFLPRRAEALLSLVAGPGAGGVAGVGAALSLAPRPERLRALAGAIEPLPLPERRARAEAVAAGERPRVAAAALAAGRVREGGPVAPLLARVLEERFLATAEEGSGARPAGPRREPLPRPEPRSEGTRRGHAAWSDALPCSPSPLPSPP